MTEKDAARYPDSLQTQNRGLVRVLDLRDEDRLKIKVGNSTHWVQVKDIPLNAALLSCGHTVRGIALNVDNVVFCDKCHEDRFVAEVH